MTILVGPEARPKATHLQKTTPATWRQIETLIGLGVPPQTAYAKTNYEANTIIAQKLNLPSPKNKKALQRLGYSRKEIDCMTAQEADRKAKQSISDKLLADTESRIRLKDLIEMMG